MGTDNPHFARIAFWSPLPSSLKQHPHCLFLHDFRTHLLANSCLQNFLRFNKKKVFVYVDCQFSDRNKKNPKLNELELLFRITWKWEKRGKQEKTWTIEFYLVLCVTSKKDSLTPGTLRNTGRNPWYCNITEGWFSYISPCRNKPMEKWELWTVKERAVKRATLPIHSPNSIFKLVCTSFNYCWIFFVVICYETKNSLSVCRIFSQINARSEWPRSHFWKKTQTCWCGHLEYSLIKFWRIFFCTKSKKLQIYELVQKTPKMFI